MKSHERKSASICIPLVIYTWLFFVGSTTVSAAPVDLAAFSTSDGQQQIEPQPVGILDFESNNVDPGEARAITDRFRLYLGNQAIFQVIERRRMQDILNEVGFQITGACDTEECIVQVGKILGARKMIAGSVSRVGTLYSLQVRIIDIETSMVEHQAVADVSGIEDVLTSACESVANELAQKASGQTGITQPIEGPDQPVVLTTGQVRVTSTPPGATIIFDGREVGVAPATVQLSEGSHELLLNLAGYQSHTDTIDVIGGESRTIDVQLNAIASGYVQISTNPPGVTVLINDEEVGVTPIESQRVFEGRHRIELKKDGYDTETRDLEFPPNRTTFLEVTLLRSGQAQLSLQSGLRGATISVNGQRQSQVLPAQGLTLRPGSYSIEVKAVGYHVWNRSIDLNDGDNQTLTVILSPKSRTTAGALSLLIPGMGQFYSRRPASGVLMLVGNAALTGYSAALYSQRNTLQDEYAVLQSRYDQASSIDEVTQARAVLLAKHQELQNNHQRLSTMGLVLGGLWALNVLDAVALMPRLPSVIPGASRPEIKIRAKTGTVSIALSVVF